MAIDGALQSALTGLRIAQAGLDVVGQNVANAGQAGYTRKILQQSTQIVGNRIVGLRSSGTVRTVDTLLQRSLRTEIAGGQFATQTAQFADRLDQLFGPPGNDAALDSIFSRFTNALQGLSASPENPVARSSALSQANVLVDRVQGIADSIQSLRTEAEQGLNNAVTRANDALRRISEIDQQITATAANSQEPSDLLDARDRAINDLSEIFDIRVQERSDRSVSIFTRSGVSLFDRQAARLSFDPRATITPQQSYNIDPSQRGVGTVSLTTLSGQSVDLVAQGTFRSGEIAALLNVRDKILPEAQAQLDEFAAGLASALSDKTINSNAVSNVGGAGFAIDVAQLQPGNTVSLQVNVGGALRNITIIRVDDPSKLPLSDNVTASTNDEVIGINFSGGNAAAASALQSALQVKFGNGVTVSSPGTAPSTLEIVSNGSNTTTLTALSAKVTETSLSGGTTALPFFVDSGRAQSLFSNSLDFNAQKIGFSQRFAVNPALLSDPARLVQLSSTTASGDPARPNAILDALTRTNRLFSPIGTIGSTSSPASATLSGYLQRVVGDKGQFSQTAKSIDDGQKIVVAGLQTRFDASTKVNVDEELANLISLQQSYQASARVLTVVRDLTQALLNS